jgi:alkanesulfonate monooxygenase SsuD/methylene tetrahydromethanopterin reductase-like flavin-dependent oxidoreductase (luciferase family)
MGLRPRRALSSVLADLNSIRSLLEGQTVTHVGGDGHALHGVALAFPPRPAPPMLLGAVNEKALRAAGAHADGVLLSVLAGATYIEWAAEHIRLGAAEVGRQPPPITAFVLCSVDADSDLAGRAVADAVELFVRAESHTALITHSAFGDTLKLSESAWTPETRQQALREFSAAGTPQHVAGHLSALLAAGADALGLWVFPSDHLPTQLHSLANDVIPRIRVRTTGRPWQSHHSSGQVGSIGLP